MESELDRGVESLLTALPRAPPVHNLARASGACKPREIQTSASTWSMGLENTNQLTAAGCELTINWLTE